MARRSDCRGAASTSAAAEAPARQRGNDLAIDEVTLRSIARITGGTYARAADAPQLERAFRDLPMRIYTVKEVHELTVYLVALGALLAMGAMATSRWWNRFS